ncbi:MAG: mismatch repair protein MutS, partial [Pseudomonadota bacterium]
MPSAVLRQAKQTLDTLEAQQHAGEAQIDLFAPPPEPAFAPPAPPPAVAPETVDPLADEVLQALRALDPDTLTPRSALDALYQLQALATRTP